MIFITFFNVFVDSVFFVDLLAKTSDFEYAASEALQYDIFHYKFYKSFIGKGLCLFKKIIRKGKNVIKNKINY